MKPLYQRIFPRSVFELDNCWLPRPPQMAIMSAFDLNDDDDDHFKSQKLAFLDEPSIFRHLLNAKKSARKHRVRVDLHGLSPKCVKTEFSADKSKLVVSAKEGERSDNDEDANFFVKEFRRTFELPANVETDKMTSFVTRNDHLVIEIPIREEESNNELVASKRKTLTSDEKSKRVQNENETLSGSKRVKWNVELPNDVDSSKIKVTCHDRNVIVEARDRVETPDGGVSQVYFYRRNMLPENADLDRVKCVLLENNRLMIEAPFLATKEIEESNEMTIPIESKQSQQQQEQQQPQQKQQVVTIETIEDNED